MMRTSVVHVPQPDDTEDIVCDVKYYYYPEALGCAKMPYQPAEVEIMFVSVFGKGIMDKLSGKQFDFIEDFLIEQHQGDTNEYIR